MPMMSEIRRQFNSSASDEMFAFHDESVADTTDETLISDARSGMRPMQIIERKFGVALLRESGRLESDYKTSSTRFQ